MERAMPEVLANMVTEFLAQNGTGQHMWGGDWGGGWMWMMAVPMMAAFVVLAIAALIWAVRSTSHSVESRQSHARQILEERYARGEIATDEYQERLRELS